MAAASPAPASAARTGIDVSRFQGAIDWEQVAGSGVSFAFVAASRGSGDDCAVAPRDCGADPYFAANRAAARAAGIRIGPYHRAFVNGGGDRDEVVADARAEADVFIGSVGALRKKELIPALDVETPFDVADDVTLRLWVSVWLKRVRKHLRARPMIYTNATSWSATGDTQRFARNGHRLWVANWGVSRPAVPAGNWAGRGWTVWQYTSSGRVAGITGRVDMNRMRVRIKKLRAR